MQKNPQKCRSTSLYFSLFIRKTENSSGVSKEVEESTNQKFQGFFLSLFPKGDLFGLPSFHWPAMEFQFHSSAVVVLFPFITLIWTKVLFVSIFADNPLLFLFGARLVIIKRYYKLFISIIRRWWQKIPFFYFSLSLHFSEDRVSKKFGKKERSRIWPIGLLGTINTLHEEKEGEAEDDDEDDSRGWAHGSNFGLNHSALAPYYEYC